MSKGQLNIDLLGTSFAIQADETDEYLNTIYTHYVHTIEQVRQTSSVKDPVRLAIIAGILITDELYKEQLKADTAHVAVKNGIAHTREIPDSIEIEKSAQRMMEKIDKVLDGKNENLG